MIVARSTGIQVLKCEWEMSYSINYYILLSNCGEPQSPSHPGASSYGVIHLANLASSGTKHHAKHFCSMLKAVSLLRQSNQLHASLINFTVKETSNSAVHSISTRNK
jgi:hypothetical protein